jgi:phosphopantothenate-cysteine ligase
MDQVPKILKPMVDEWTPDGFVVSFKVCSLSRTVPLLLCLTHLIQLETDQSLLIPKSEAALKRYGHQIVIGNDLHRRKHEVVFVSRNPSSPNAMSEAWLRIEPHAVDSLGRPREIEEDIVAELARRHSAWIEIL